MLTGDAAPDRDIHAAAHFFEKSRDRRNRDLDLWIRVVESTKPWDQPAHREAGRGAHAQDASRTGPPTSLRGNGQAIERTTDFRCKDSRHWRRHHAATILSEKLLTQPSFERRDLPADRAMGDAELSRSFGIAAGACGDLENSDRIERWQATHNP